MIAKTKEGIKREFKIYKDGIEDLNGYPPYRIAVRVIVEYAETEFVNYSMIKEQFDNEENAESYLKEHLRINNNIIRKELSND